jgi:two-component system LytT family sensor kinase
MHRRWLEISLVVGGWALAGFVLTLELYFNNRVTMRYVDWADLAIAQFGRALMWALLAPLILRMREKMPLRAGGWIGGLSFHFVASFVVMATYYLGRIFTIRLLWGGGESGFWVTARESFYGHNLIDMAYYWGVIAFGYGVEIYRRFRSEELRAAQLEARLIETELKALRQQMHPHFLFNTMNTIAVLVREGRNDAAVSLLAQLSSLLRMSLDNTGVAEVTLRQEMAFLDKYLAIQKTRFADRLAVTVDISAAAMEALIPNLLLQPLVENAIVHGVASKVGPGRVEVRGQVGDGQLRLEVSDDGPGLPADAERAKEGIGLTNTRERLAKIYGGSSQLLLRSAPGRGVSVQILMPYRT